MKMVLVLLGHAVYFKGQFILCRSRGRSMAIQVGSRNHVHLNNSTKHESEISGNFIVPLVESVRPAVRGLWPTAK